MSYSSVKLTKRVIDAASAGAARRIIWDTELRGFGVRVETSGTKSFLIRYRPKGNGRNGPKRFVTIGRYGAMTPEQARNEARSGLVAAMLASGDFKGIRRKRLPIFVLGADHAFQASFEMQTPHSPPASSRHELARICCIPA